MFISDSDQQQSINRTGSIYIIRNTVNDKVYIGQTTMTVHARFMTHLRPSTYKKLGTYKIYNAMNKYGTENFYYEVLEENVPINELDKKEIAYIKKFDSFYNGYNSTPGGNVRRIHEEIDIQNIIELFAQGKSSKEIGEIYGVHGATILRTIHGSGYTVHDQIDEDLLKLLFDCNLNNEQIAYMMNSKEWTIQRSLRKYNLRRKRAPYFCRTDINVEAFVQEWQNGTSDKCLCDRYDIDKKTIKPLILKYYNEQLEKCNDYGVKSSTSEDELPMEVQSNPMG